MELAEKKQRIIEKIQEIYPEKGGEVEVWLNTQGPLSFRVNTLKSTSEKVIQSLLAQGFKIENGPVVNGYVVTDSVKRLSETSEFNEGLIYIQSLSSMVPALVLEPKEGENILDLCAAPGSKTTQMADLANNGANIWAVESNKERFFTLKRNLENYGVKNFNLILSNAVGLDKKHSELINFFDKVLVDVPCSNESLIDFSDPSTYKFWNSKRAKSLSKLQKGILAAGVNLLKPGGTLVYSTCTFSVEENEMVIDWVLKRMPELKVEEIKIEYDEILTSEGFVEWKEKSLNQEVSKTLRILPSNRFSGFYLAKLKKA